MATPDRERLRESMNSVGSTNSLTFNSAELCRGQGWGPGTRIVGDEGYGPCVIEITAVGEWSILAKCVDPHREEREGSWTLAHRDWREIREGAG